MSSSVSSSVPAKRSRHEATVGTGAGEGTAAGDSGEGAGAAAIDDSGVSTDEARASSAATGSASHLLHTGALSASRSTGGSGAAASTAAASGAAAAAEPHRKRPRGAWALKNDLLDPRTAAANAVRPGASVVVEKLVAAGCAGQFAQRPRQPPPPTDTARAGAGGTDTAAAASASSADPAASAAASGALPASAAPEITSQASAGQVVRGSGVLDGGRDTGAGSAAGGADAIAR